jgi:hypothetical protein
MTHLKITYIILYLWKVATDEHVYASDWGRFDCIVAQSEDKDAQQNFVAVRNCNSGSEQSSEGNTDTY